MKKLVVLGGGESGIGAALLAKNNNYDVFVSDQNNAKILMTLTSPNCPVAETLPVEVEDKVKTLKQINECEVEITFDPTWTQEMMSEEAKLELGML